MLKKIKNSLIYVGVILFLALSIIFFIYELNSYQNNYLNNYKEEQDMLVQSVSNEISRYIKDNQGETEVNKEKYIIENILSAQETWGSRYWVLVKNDKVIFLKDTSYNETLDEVENYNIDLNLVSKSKIDPTYELNLITEKKYALISGKLISHKIYMSLLFLIIISISIGMMLLLLIKMKKTDKKSEEISKKLIEKNLILETIVKRKECKQLRGEEKDKVYDKLFLKSFLEKVYKMEDVYLEIIIIYPRKDLKKILNYILINKKENYVVCKLNDNVIALLLVKGKKGEAEEFINELGRYDKGVSYGIASSNHIIKASNELVDLALEDYKFRNGEQL